MTGGTANLPALPQAIERRSRVPVEVFSPLEKIAVDAGSVDRAPSSHGSARSSRSRSGSRCAKTGRSAHDSRQPPAAEARGETASSEASGQTWLLAVLGVVVARDRGRSFLFHQVKHDELAKQTRDQRRAHEPDRPDQESRGQPRRGQGPARGAARARRRHLQAAVGAHRPDRGVARAGARAHRGRGPTIDPDASPSFAATTRRAVYNPGWDPRRLWLTSFTRPSASSKIDGSGARRRRRLRARSAAQPVGLLCGREALAGQQDRGQRIEARRHPVSAAGEDEVLTWPTPEPRESTRSSAKVGRGFIVVGLTGRRLLRAASTVTCPTPSPEQKKEAAVSLKPTCVNVEAKRVRIPQGLGRADRAPATAARAQQDPSRNDRVSGVPIGRSGVANCLGSRRFRAGHPTTKWCRNSLPAFR